MKSVIVLSVSASGAVFIFLRSRSTLLSPSICFVIAVLRYAAEALALLCERSRLLEGGEVAALF
jgi:hypothetical protein